MINTQKFDILLIINEEGYLQKLPIQNIFEQFLKCYWISLHHKNKIITFFKIHSTNIIDQKLKNCFVLFLLWKKTYGNVTAYSTLCEISNNVDNKS